MPRGLGSRPPRRAPGLVPLVPARQRVCTQGCWLLLQRFPEPNGSPGCVPGRGEPPQACARTPCRVTAADIYSSLCGARDAAHVTRARACCVQRSLSTTAMCPKVGCDGRDLSGLAVDPCGVCGGNGSSCADWCASARPSRSACQHDPSSSAWNTFCSSWDTFCTRQRKCRRWSACATCHRCGVPNGDNSSCTDACGLLYLPNNTAYIVGQTCRTIGPSSTTTILS